MKNLPSQGRPHYRRLYAFCSVIVAAICIAAVGGASTPAAGTPAVPSTMAALGDSISNAFNTHADPAIVPNPVDLSACPDGEGGLTGYPFDCPRNSWSTGTNPAVNSVYLRLISTDTALAGHQYNDAVSGVSVSDLPRQAQQAVQQGADFVTIDIGVNDACTPTVADETSIPSYTSQFRDAMSTLAKSPTHPTIEVISIPNVYREWQLFHNDPNAQFRWSLAQICQAMFANPTSTSSVDSARRLAVTARIIAYNAVMADVCQHTPRCTSDSGAVFAWPFSADDISTVANTGSITNVPALATFPVFGPGIPNSTGDYFHPSVTGQARLAELAWAASPFAANGN